jgi:hypothetical protein
MLAVTEALLGQVYLVTIVAHPCLEHRAPSATGAPARASEQSNARWRRPTRPGARRSRRTAQQPQSPWG